ncbi:MAG: RMD1 family protein [Candidatus Dadabacteria bacterium]|nr:MAG: RMD1 family protein [Candidatus Dadabacteria bacterium]
MNGAPNRKKQSNQFRLYARGLPGKLVFTKLRSLFQHSELRLSSADVVIIEKSSEARIYCFKFGSLVFINVPYEESQQIINKIRKTHGLEPSPDHIVEDDFILLIGKEVKIDFNSVTIPKWDEDWVLGICEVLAKSNALEIAEYKSEGLLRESESLTRRLKKGGWFRPSRNELLDFLNRALLVRHSLLTQLAILDQPEQVWEDEQLYQLYTKMIEHFEIHSRVENIEKMLQLCAEVSEFQLELFNAMRSEILELIIIILIMVEIIQLLI